MTKSTRPSITNDTYWRKTYQELRYIIKDAAEASINMRGMDDAAEAKYLDQINDAVTVLHYRRTAGTIRTATFYPRQQILRLWVQPQMSGERKAVDLDAARKLIADSGVKQKLIVEA